MGVVGWRGGGCGTAVRCTKQAGLIELVEMLLKEERELIHASDEEGCASALGGGSEAESTGITRARRQSPASRAHAKSKKNWHSGPRA